MTDIQSIQAYLRGFLEEAGIKQKYIGIDWLDMQPDSFSIEMVPANPVVKQFTGGASIRQYLFVFATRFCYSEDDLQNLQNLDFFQDFAAWLEKNNRARILPELTYGKEAVSIEALDAGGLLSGEDNGHGRYHIQCRLTYYQGVNEEE